MTTDSVLILFKKTDFNTTLACLGVSVIGGHTIFVAEVGRLQFYRRRLFVNFGTLFRRNASPLNTLNLEERTRKNKNKNKNKNKTKTKQKKTTNKQTNKQTNKKQASLAQKGEKG